jgi:Grap2 and cyclin-D-interacting
LQKSAITEATGKIWEDCDELKELADKGIAGFVIKKAEQHLELIKDAVKEIEDWDPEEEEDEEDDTDDDSFLAAESHAPNPNNNAEKPGDTPDKKTQEMKQVQQASLKILTRIPQSLHVVLHQRLKKGLPPDPTTAHRLILDKLLTNMEQTSTCVDDVAERMYTHDALGAILTMEKVRGLVIEIVESVLNGWDSLPAPTSSASTAAEARKKPSKQGEGREVGGRSPDAHRETAAAAAAADAKAATTTETKEDRYVKRALEWIKGVGMRTDVGR